MRRTRAGAGSRRRSARDPARRRARGPGTCVCGSRGARLRATTHVARLPRRPGDVPDVSHDARSVRLGCGAPDRGVYPEADRPVCDRRADQVGARGQCLGRHPRRAPAQGLRPPGVVVADRRARRRRPAPGARRLALEPHARARRRAGARRRGCRTAAGRVAGTIGLMGARLPIAFLAGFASVITPCVLPLVPGYLSAVSSVEAGRLGERDTVGRVVRASIPFILGFTIVFVVLGAAAAAIGGTVSGNAQAEIAGFVLVVLGLAFVGLIPVPERVLAPGLLAGARKRGSGALLGGAFAVCAAPCIGTVLAAVLVLASNTGTLLKGAVLLAAYALGLAAAFLLAGVAFARAMGAFRWLRDRYTVIQVTSGIVLVALGLLLFFHRDWWLHVALNRALDDLGLTKP